jgi:protein-disulfide isomerase
MTQLSKLSSIAVVATSAAVLTLCAHDMSVTRAASNRRAVALSKSSDSVRRFAPPDGLVTATSEAVDNLTVAVPPTRRLDRNAASAKVVVIEFTDYQCGYCGRYTRDTYPKIRDKFINTDIVEYVLRNFPMEQIHPVAVDASKAAICAGEQGQLLEMHRLLFEHQEAIEQPVLITLAMQLRLDSKPFRTCLLQPRTAAKLRAEIEEGTAAGVNGTPTFLMGLRQDEATVRVLRRIKGAQTFEVFEAVIQELLDSAAHT